MQTGPDDIEPLQKHYQVLKPLIDRLEVMDEIYKKQNDQASNWNRAEFEHSEKFADSSIGLKSG